MHTASKTRLWQAHICRRKVDESGSTSQYDNTAHYVQHKNQDQQWEKRLPSLSSLILRSWSRPWARSWAGGWTFLPRLRTAVILMWGRGAGSRFGDALLLPVLSWGSWTTARFLVTRPLLGSTARIPLWLHLRSALGPRLGFPIGWTGLGFAGSWTRFRFTGMRTRPAIARSRLPSRSGARMMSLVAVGTRPVKNKRNAYTLRFDIPIQKDSIAYTSTTIL